MTRIRLILLSMMAVLGVSVVAATSASAAEPLTRYTVAGSEITGTKAVTGSVGTAQLNSVILTSKIMIECTKNELKNALIGPIGKSSGEIKFETCTLYTIEKGKKTSQATKCKVTEPITFKFIDLLIMGPGGLIEDEFKPAVGEEFVTIHLENNGAETCALKGAYETTGSYVASLGAEGEVSKTEHEVVYTSTGSKVKLHKEPTSFTNKTTLKLVSGEEWLVN